MLLYKTNIDLQSKECIQLSSTGRVSLFTFGPVSDVFFYIFRVFYDLVVIFAITLEEILFYGKMCEI